MSRVRQVPARRETRAHQRKVLVDRYVRLGLIAVGVIVLALLAFGVYRVTVVAPNEPVAVVGGHKITTREYQARVRYNRLNLLAQIRAIQEQLYSLDTGDESSSYIQELYQQQLSSLQSSYTSIPLQTLEDMIEEELVRQEAERRGLSASPAEVEHQTENWFGYNIDTPTPEPTVAATDTPEFTTPTPEPTQEPTSTVLPALTETPESDGSATTTATYTVLLGSDTLGTPVATDTPGPTATPRPTSTPITQEGYEAMRSEYLAYIAEQAGISRDAFADMMEVLVLEDKLEPLLQAEVPTSAPQVHIRHILVNSQEEADKVVARIEAGEDFAAVAAEVSLDLSAGEGGDLGWVSEWDSAANSTVFAKALQMTVGEISIVVSSEGYHVVELLEKADDRPLSDFALEQRRSGALKAWLEEQSQGENVKRYWSSDKVPQDTSSG